MIKVAAADASRTARPISISRRRTTDLIEDDAPKYTVDLVDRVSAAPSSP